MDTAELIRHLQEPACYSPRPVAVTLRETHASAVFLAGARAYKLKKPVNLGFLDFSTLEKRQRACADEVRLNRRLAPDVYLGVEPVVVNGGAVSVGGPGTVIDYVVVMRRLADNASLQALIERGEATDCHVRGVAEHLAAFHLEAERGPRIDTFGRPEAIAANIEENFAQAEPFVGSTIERVVLDEISRSSWEFLAEHERLFCDRVARGCTRDGHGDLRAEHLYFDGGRLEIIDCIEFNERFRYGDVASDLAFLAMDLERLGQPGLADTLVARYDELTPFAVREVLDFYRCYRAFVRGKVASIRWSQQPAGGTAAESALADARLHFGLSRVYAGRLAGATAARR